MRLKEISQITKILILMQKNLMSFMLQKERYNPTKESRRIRNNGTSAPTPQDLLKIKLIQSINDEEKKLITT